MTQHTIDNQLQLDLYRIISTLRPGQVYSYFNMILTSPDINDISDLPEPSISDIYLIDSEYVMDVYAGRFPDVRHIGTDNRGNNLNEKLGPNAVTNIF